MNTLEAIFGRSSIRRFTDQAVSDETICTVLKAGMSGPSCADTRDWSFLVVTDREKLSAMAEANGPYAVPLKQAAFGVLICGDLERAFPPARDYWVVDGAIAGQNMILAARELGLGSVWLGTWPQTERVRALSALFTLPETQVPHSVIAFGYPDEEPVITRPDWEADRVHMEQW